jgi:hypothetical protein
VLALEIEVGICWAFKTQMQFQTLRFVKETFSLTKAILRKAKAQRKEKLSLQGV